MTILSGDGSEENLQYSLDCHDDALNSVTSGFEISVDCGYIIMSASPR